MGCSQSANQVAEPPHKKLTKSRSLTKSPNPGSKSPKPAAKI